MRDLQFFQGIEHIEVPWRERRIFAPVFYYDLLFYSGYWLASAEKVKASLPSSRMNPYRVTPGHCVVVLTAYEYRDSDLGPYNEVMIGIPFTMDEVSPLFVGTLRKGPAAPNVYIHHMPVTTEIARDVGVEFAGFPKFVAEIDLTERGEWVSCRLSQDGEHILSLSGRKLSLAPSPRSHVHAFTFRHDRLLRLEFTLSESGAGSSRDPSDVRLELGEHPIARELQDWELGRVMTYQYCPQAQVVLSPVVESYLA